MRSTSCWRNGCIVVVAVSAGIGALASSGAAQTVQLKSTLVASGLTQPLFVTHAPGDNTRLFIIEQPGRIRIVNVLQGGGFSLRSTPFLDIGSLIANHYLEYGALGLAFDPDYASNGTFYVSYTPSTTTNQIAPWTLSRFHVSPTDPNVATLASRQDILSVSYTIQEHRAGWIAFGPDNYLYATTGDGGETDPLNAAQDLTLLRGKVLRIDVRGPDGIPGTADDDDFPTDATKNYHIPANNPFVGEAGARPEIWAYGLRNPWRASFDRATGDLWIGDVGQNAWEEVDFQPASSAGGTFYGWRCLEATHPTNYAGCVSPLPASTAPILEYPHTGGGTPSGTSVTGGYVYRGCAMPSLVGTYFFGDWSGKIWTATHTGGTLANITLRTPELLPSGQTSLGTTVSFGEDAAGELYVCAWTNGQILKIEPRTLDGPDCNGNGRPDACDIAMGFSQDVNHNGIPDECEHLCAADFNHVNGLNVQDVFDFLGAWFARDVRADFNMAGGITVLDIFDFLAAWFAGCP